MKILVTGGAGFIGSNFIRYIINKYSNYKIVNLDKLTYAGNLENLRDVQDNKNYSFIRGDICDKPLVSQIVKDNVDVIINFAAETHVDRSIYDPDQFIITDIIGTKTLLDVAKENSIKKYIQISTDEVYGSIEQGSFNEDSVLNPSSPYSASKAAADLLVLSYYKTYKMPLIITRSSNNFGPYQYPEKIIPLFITNILEGKKLPIYGDGLNIRDWIYVEDNCEAIDFILHNGNIGEIYNIAANNEMVNIEITKMMLSILNKPETLITYVKDRPAHDRRYSIITNKIRNLGWKPKYIFKEALEKTINWYKENEWWWKKIKTGEYLEYYKKHYIETHKMEEK